MSSDIANYVDNTTPYEGPPILRLISRKSGIGNLQRSNCFKYNNFKANATICHFFLSPYQSASKNIDGLII